MIYIDHIDYLDHDLSVQGELTLYTMRGPTWTRGR